MWRQYARVLKLHQFVDWPRLDVGRLAAHGVDLEALELALRRRRRLNALTQSFQVVCCLAEVRSDNFSRFVTELRRVPAGWRGS